MGLTYAVDLLKLKPDMNIIKDNKKSKGSG